MIQRPRLISLAIWAVLFITVLAFAKDSTVPPRAWIAKIQSTYTDDKTGKAVIMTGTGIIARANGKSLVIADSHLSQGKDLKLKTQWGEARIPDHARFADNDLDIEVLEISSAPAGAALFEFDGKDLRLPPTEKSVFGSETCKAVGSGACMTFSPWARGAPKPVQNQVADLDLSILGQFLEGGINRSAGGMVENWRGELISDNLIFPGNSGEPALLEDEQGIRLLGLAKGYHKAFVRSFFSSSNQIVSTIGRYQAGERGIGGGTRWRYNGGTYRDYGDGVLEKIPESGSAGVEIDPSGNGETGDGGNGETGDGGNGETGDGGNGPKESSSLWGMIYQGKPVLAFKIDLGKRAGLREFSFFANPAGLAYLRKIQKEYPKAKIQVIRPGDELLPLLIPRVEKGMQRHLDSPRECYIDVKAIKKGITRIRLPLSTGYSAQTPRLSKYVFLEFDSHGRLIRPKGRSFEPIIRYKDPQNGNEATIDIRGLYFPDLSRISADAFMNGPIPPFAITAAITMKINGSKEWPINCNKTTNPNIFAPCNGGCPVDAESCTSSTGVIPSAVEDELLRKIEMRPDGQVWMR